ncbi:hypothetical protein [Roseibacillus persicicus]|uniref:Uncharacterized protein n=1 Tax=Roseibacillus persicicus TaxID=454148 RepID=A0A918TMP1_9BACT|nr:hypothetical protein [Roseibacillus persicicus]GHC55914.1 hypothetical protein GCM10007100_23460 [Roseibacillus persicicus]
MKLPPPSAAFLDYAEDHGPVVTEFDQFTQVISLPALIAASGRARSFKEHVNSRGKEFLSAGCHYIENNVTDAQAAQSDEGFCFTIFDVVPFQLIDIFSLALSAPSFFAEIGDSKLEDLGRVRAREKPAGYGFFRKNPEEALLVRSELAYPLCPVREEAALYFTGLALDAIWSHELSHAFMGHLDYASENLGVRALNELPDENGSLRQMPLEAEADRFSAQTILQGSFGSTPYLPLNLRGLPVESRVKAAFVTSAVLTWFWAYLQRIDRTFDGFDPYERGGHPPPLARLHLAFEGNRDFLKLLGWKTSSIEELTLQAMQELENLASSKDWFAILHPETVFSEKGRQFNKDIKEIMGHEFRQMHQELETYRYQPKDK